MKSDEHNQMVLDEIRNSLNTICEKYKYEFADNTNIHQFFENLVKVFKDACKDSHITYEINETGLPDVSIIEMFRERGIKVSSINDFEKIKMDVTTDDTDNIIRMSVRGTFTDDFLKKSNPYMLVYDIKS